MSIIENIKELAFRLPEDLKNALGTFLWQDRAHNCVKEGDKHIVYFYSDGLNLEQKERVETFLHANIPKDLTPLSVYFERKEKAPPKDPKPAPPKAAPAETRPPSSKKSIEGVRHIIAVASGKGGVGKSTVSVNLALALHNQGYKVGILDADIYGPSIPMMLNIHENPLLNEKNKIIPPVSFGLKVMSFGFFTPEDTPVIWRGPMIMKALQQFFWDVAWDDLDFLVIDLPPGTGDAQLTLVQSIPISGAVIVTTPQNVALLDAVKGVAMFRKTDVPVLGVVENMSFYSCPTCGSQTHIFGEGGAQRISDKFQVPLLGHVPLVPEIRAAGDLGEPLTAIAGHGIRSRFGEIAEKMVKTLFDMRG